MNQAENKMAFIHCQNSSYITKYQAKKSATPQSIFSTNSNFLLGYQSHLFIKKDLRGDLLEERETYYLKNYQKGGFGPQYETSLLNIEIWLLMQQEHIPRFSQSIELQNLFNNFIIYHSFIIHHVAEIKSLYYLIFQIFRIFPIFSQYSTKKILLGT